MMTTKIKAKKIMMIKKIEFVVKFEIQRKQNNFDEMKTTKQSLKC